MQLGRGGCRGEEERGKRGDDDADDDDDDDDNVWHESVTPSLREPSPGERERTRPGGEQV